MYEEWKANPASVDPSWTSTFEAIERNLPAGKIPVPERTSKVSNQIIFMIMKMRNSFQEGRGIASFFYFLD
jgi:2-oxoglutarate dehydrogenase complex dehydrogenase (E1) component-like enzyme